MKKISFEIKSQEDRRDIVKALAESGYAVKVEERTEYYSRKTFVVVWVGDTEVQNAQDIQ